MAPRTEAVTDAGSSIVEYERWLDGGDQRILDQLAEYNRVDCHSTALLRQWLEERRGEYEERFGTAPPR
ncbi:MAG: ribonuclease H-like domain-containing protein, partial [Acidimicrobiales bacterium]